MIRAARSRAPLRDASDPRRAAVIRRMPQLRAAAASDCRAARHDAFSYTPLVDYCHYFAIATPPIIFAITLILMPCHAYCRLLRAAPAAASCHFAIIDLFSVSLSMPAFH
jgi:hypothetical protein